MQGPYNDNDNDNDNNNNNNNNNNNIKNNAWATAMSRVKIIGKSHHDWPKNRYSR